MDQQKFAEQVFNGSLAILAVLIAVAGILSAEYAKPAVSGSEDIGPVYKLCLLAVAGLSGWACLTSFFALAKLAGREIQTWVVVCSIIILLLGTTAASIGIVIVTLNY